MNKILIFTLFFINLSISLQSSFIFRDYSLPAELDYVYLSDPEEKEETSDNELNPLQPYHTFKQEQNITYQQLPNDIQKIIADYAGLNESDSHWTILQSAAMYGDFEQVQLLTILGVDLNKINSTSCYANTPLIEAIKTLNIINIHIDTDNKRKNKYNIAQYLIWRGADVNKSDQYHNTPLHYAVECHNIPGLRLLLSAQANPNIENELHKTPLDRAHIAAMNHFSPHPLNREKSYRIAQILTRYGAKSSIPLKIMPSDEIMHKQNERASI